MKSPKVLYTIYDDSGDVYKDNLTMVDVLDEVNAISQDEEMTTMKDAKKGFAMINYRVERMKRGGNAQKKVRKVMHEFKEGELTSHGRKVTDRKQAVAIALSEAGLSKKMQGGWIDSLTFDEKNFCKLVANKFMGVQSTETCENDDCLKSIDKEKLKQTIINIKEQLSSDGIELANSTINKL